MQTKQQTNSQTASVVALMLGAVGLFIALAILSLHSFLLPEDGGGGGGFVPITNASTVFSIPNVARPDYLQSQRDPTFGTLVTRISGNSTGTTAHSFTYTDQTATPPTTKTGTWGLDARHTYSKVQPWNADQSLLAVENNGTGASGTYFVILDGATYTGKYRECGGRWDDRWLPTMSHRFERVNVPDGGATLWWYDVRTCTITKNWTLPFGVTDIGSGEGNVSQDGRFVALSGPVGDHVEAFVVDMAPPSTSSLPTTGVIGPRLNISDCGLSKCDIDWVSVSPDGNYVLVSYQGDHVRVYDLDRTESKYRPDTSSGYLKLTKHDYTAAANKECGSHLRTEGFIYDLGHADMGYATNGDLVIVGQRRDECGSSQKDNLNRAMGSVVMVRIRDGYVTSITNPTNEAAAHHISLRNYNRPGWAYVGFYESSGKRFSDEVVAVKLDTSYGVERYAHKHELMEGPPPDTTTHCYRCESHPVPSPDGKRMIFASNWYQHTLGTLPEFFDVKDYVVDAR